MTAKNDERPVPRKRTPRPAPDADRDPMDLPAGSPAVPKPAAQEQDPEPAKASRPVQAKRAVPGSVPVSRKDPEDRAVVQLGVRVSVKVDEHLEAVRAATGRTRRELVESAIMALRVP